MTAGPKERNQGDSLSDFLFHAPRYLPPPTLLTDFSPEVIFFFFNPFSCFHRKTPRRIAPPKPCHGSPDT